MTLKLRIIFFFCLINLIPDIPLKAEDAERLVAWWAMDKITNGIIEDKSGNGNEAKVFGHISLRDGQEGQCAFFDGNGKNHLEIEASKNLDNLLAFRIEGWVKYSNLFAFENGENNYPIFLGRGDCKKYPALWLFPGFHKANSSSFSRFCAWIGTPANFASVLGVYSEALGWEKDKWYKISISVKPGLIQFFRDDAKIGENKLPDDYNFGCGNIYIGALKDNGFPMHGCIDEVKIYAIDIPEKDAPVLITIDTDKVDSTYKCGEPAVFKISLERMGKFLHGESIKYSLSNDGGKELEHGERICDSNPIEIKYSSNDPGFLRCTATYSGNGKKYTALRAAAFEPEKIRCTTQEPPDFKDFWEKEKEELAKVPIDPQLTKSETYSSSSITVYKIRLGNIRGAHVYGWFAVPQGKGPFPAILTLPYAGVYPLSGHPGGECLNWVQKGFIAMGISIHDCDVDLATNDYKKLPQFSSGYYASTGKDNRETCYFLRGILGAVRAIDYLTSRPDWDRKNMIVNGSSQGGGLTIITAGLDPRVTAAAANVPALCEHTGKFYERPSGWPDFVPAGNKRVAEVAAYFDAVNFARYIKCPMLISVGFIDTTCPPTTVYSAFNVINSEKQILPYPKMGHSQIKAYVDIRDKWILEQTKRMK